MAAPTYATGDATGHLKSGRYIAKGSNDFRFRSHIEFALLALAVGILGVGEGRVTIGR